MHVHDKKHIQTHFIQRHYFFLNLNICEAITNTLLKPAFTSSKGLVPKQSTKLS